MYTESRSVWFTQGLLYTTLIQVAASLALTAIEATEPNAEGLPLGGTFGLWARPY